MRDGQDEWWQQDPDGRGFPPDEPFGEVHHQPTQRMEVLPPAPPPPPKERPPDPLVTDLYGRYLRLPRWIRGVTWVAAATVVLGVVFVATDPSNVPTEEPVVAGPATTSTTATTTPTAAGADQGSTPATTAAPGAPAPDDPLALCAPGQREAIQRAKHPWEWYQERYDPDGNGVLCE